MSLIQMRPEGGAAFGTLEWVAYASNAFNTMVPFYADVDETPEYLANTTGEVSTGKMCIRDSTSRHFRQKYITETETWYLSFRPDIPQEVEKLKQTLAAETA